MSSPLLVDVSNLRKRLGSTQEVDVDIVLEPLAVLDSHLTDGEPVVGRLLLSSIERGVTVDGRLAVPWSASCRRCLDEVTGITDTVVAEIFQLGATDDDELIDFDGTTVDLEIPIREAVLGALPLAPLCRDDCEGPDPERFPTQVERDDDGTERPGDPRWAALGDLDFG